MKTNQNRLAQFVALAGAVFVVAGCGSSPKKTARPQFRPPAVPAEPAIGLPGAEPTATAGVNSGSTTPAAGPSTTAGSAGRPPVNLSLVALELPRQKGNVKAAAPQKKSVASFSLATAGVDGGEEQDLSPVITGVSRVTFAEEGSDFDPCVSRDGGTLVFASTQHRQNSDIYLKRTDSRVVTQLTNDPGQDAMPAISPDGTKIAFSSDRAGNWDIYVMPVSGGRAVQVTNDLADDVNPSWSPDGRHLVFSRQGQSSGRWEMWVTDVANPAVANFIGYGLLPQWCPVPGTGSNGADRILYQLGRERGRRTFSLWTVDLLGGTTGNATEIATSGETALIDPSWSPDGRWVVYTVSGVADGSERPAWATLWMISTEGEAKVRLTGGTGLAISPTWAANNRLFFVSDRSGADNIWSLDLSPAVKSAHATLRPGEDYRAIATTPPASTTVTSPAQPPVQAQPIVNVPDPFQPH
jgi:TolB protein